MYICNDYLYYMSMTTNLNLAAQNQNLICQLPESLRNEYYDYCADFSTEFETLFLAELEKLKGDPESQHCFWDCFTHYAAHHAAGKSAKLFTGDEELDKRLSYLYNAYDVDKEHLQKWTIEKELAFIGKALRKHGFNLAMTTLNQLQWYREQTLNNGNYPVEKYLDYFEIDDSIKEQITNDLKLEFYYDDVFIKELFKNEGLNGQ